jgi:hypothetical protein
VLGGDWKQLLPVIEGAPLQVQAANSVKASPLFSQFTTLRLSKNMRADADQKEFADWLCQVGNGRNFISGKNEIQLPNECVSNSIEELIEFCFEDLFNNPVQKFDKLADAALLAPRNDSVAHINELAMAKIPGEEKIYFSEHSPFDADKEKDFKEVYSETMK